MNLPSLPSGVNQITLVLIVAAVFYIYRNTYQEADRIRTEERNFLDTANTTKMLVDSVTFSNQRNHISKRIDAIADEFNHHTVNKTLALQKQNQHIVDSLTGVLETVDIGLFYATDRLENFRKKVLSFKSQLADAEDLDGPVTFVLIELGVFFFVILFLIGREEKVAFEAQAFQRIQLAQSVGFIRCQSCAKIFSSRLAHGKEEDGTPNEHFCKECYEGGKFTKPDLTADQVIKSLMNSSIGTFDSKFWRWLSSKLFNREKKLSKFVHDMERWNNDPYKPTRLNNRLM